MKIITLVFLVITSLSTSAQESVLLRLNYTQGDKYVVEEESAQSMGFHGETKMNMTMEMTVTEVTAKNIKTESKVTSVVSNLMQAGMTISYDSNKKDEELDDMAQMMKLKYDPMMKVTIHTTLDKIGNMIEAKIEPAIPGMEQLTGNTSTLQYPVEEVSIGSSWNSEVENQGIKMNTIYTVSNIANGIVTLDISGDVSGTGTGTIEGIITIDIDSGIKTSAVLEVTVSTQGVEMNITSKKTMTKI